MDAAYHIVIEQRRVKQKQSQQWIETCKNDIQRSLLIMQNDIEKIGKTTHLAHLSFATAVSYLELRLDYLIQGEEFNALMDWYQTFSQQKEMLVTKFS